REDACALRPIIQSYYDPNQASLTLEAFETPTIIARVPSLALVKHLDRSLAVIDVAQKIAAAYTRLSNLLGGYEVPIFYNLLTSLPRVYDSNSQIYSAHIIF